MKTPQYSFDDNTLFNSSMNISCSDVKANHSELLK